MVLRRLASVVAIPPDGPQRRYRLAPRRMSWLLSALLVVTALGAVGPGWAQGPEAYGLPHLFALPTGTTTRQFGMGGSSTCMQDIGYPNPAFLGSLTGAQGGLRVSCTEFDGGIDLTGTQGWYATRIAEGEGVQVLGFDLDSARGGVAIPGAGTLPGSLHETDVAFHYGRRLSEQWLVGIGASPVMHTTFNVYSPADGSAMMHTDSTAQLGCRVGAVYQYAPEGYAGFVFDRYTEDVSFRSPEMAGPVSFDFTSTEWALGASGRLSEQVLGVVEWMELRSKDGDMEAKSEGLHLGVEVEAAQRVRLRAGSNDGALSLGAGYDRDGWVVNYAYVSDWNDDEVGAWLGGSETHQIEIGRSW